MHLKDIQKIVDNFCVSGEVIRIEPVTKGHINTTFRVFLRSASGNTEQYTLQTINKYVFKNPVIVMENIVTVTNYIKEKIKAEGGEPRRRCLTVVFAKNGLPYYLDDSGEYWRMYEYIDGSHTFDMVESAAQLYRAGVGFGSFQRMMADFPMDKLHETIPDFHNTPMRFTQLMDAVAEDKKNRAASVMREIEFFREREAEMSILTDLARDKKIPLRVTHNDTKFNNILIDDETGQALCVIDLDTVMPGLSVLDFGDAIRFAANTAPEDEVDLSRVSINMDLYKGFAEGFLSALGGGLTSTEIRFMPWGAKIITMELASRFLADHLNGDVYFRIHRENQNLDRARCQIKLAMSMEENFDEMNEIISKFL